MLCKLYMVFWTFSPFSFNYNISLAVDKTDLYIFYRTITATVSTITLNLKTITVLLTSLLAPP